MAQFYETLLGHIINSRVIVLDKKIIELEATPTQEVNEDLERIERARKRGQSEDIRPFSRALVYAYQNVQAGKPTVDLRQSVPEEDDMADAMIQYLVKPDLATVITEDAGNNNYIYHIEVDWNALDTVAREVGLDLRGHLSRGHEA